MNDDGQELSRNMGEAAEKNFTAYQMLCWIGSTVSLCTDGRLALWRSSFPCTNKRECELPRVLAYLATREKKGGHPQVPDI